MISLIDCIVRLTAKTPRWRRGANLENYKMLSRTLLDPSSQGNSFHPNTSHDIPARRAAAWLADRLERGTKQRMIEIVSVTPAMAELILAQCNHGNRHFIEARVRRYADVMRRGEWLLTDHGISFSREGILNDGQHRLHAIVQANVSVEMTVTFGCAREEFSVIDQGAARGGDDLLSIAGFKNASVASSLVASIWRIEHKAVNNPTPKMILEYARSLPREPLDRAVSAGQAAQKRTSPTASALAYYAIEHKSSLSHKLPDFWHHFVTGEMLPKGSPILTLHDALKDRKQLGGIVTRQSSVQRAAAIIISWNTWATKGRRASLAWPHAVVLPEVR